MSKHAEYRSIELATVSEGAELAELLNKQTALEATQDDKHEATKDRDELTSRLLRLAATATTVRPQHRTNSNPPCPAPTKAAELEIENPEIKFGTLIL